MKGEAGILPVEPEELSFNLVAVELIARNVGEIPDVGLAVVLIIPVCLAGRWPIKAQVVLHEVFAKQVFFQIQDLAQVVALHLNVGLANFLAGRRNEGSLLQHEDPFVGVHEKLAGQSEPGNASAEDDDIVMNVGSRFWHLAIVTE